MEKLEATGDPREKYKLLTAEELHIYKLIKQPSTRLCCDHSSRNLRNVLAKFETQNSNGSWKKKNSKMHDVPDNSFWRTCCHEIEQLNKLCKIYLNKKMDVIKFNQSSMPNFLHLLRGNYRAAVHNSQDCSGYFALKNDRKIFAEDIFCKNKMQMSQIFFQKIFWRSDTPYLMQHCSWMPLDRP